MNLPKVIADLLKAQDDFNSNEYAACFTQTAMVFDEGKTYTGQKEIEQWTIETNRKYHTIMKPLQLDTKGNEYILTTEISGTFNGSPIVLKYRFEVAGALIQSLKITG